MTAPGITVEPARLVALADRLTAAGGILDESLGMFEDPAMWTAAHAYQEYFGPATEVAATYAALATALPGYVRSAVGSLNQGADAFRSAAALFATAEAENAARLQHAGPR